MLCPKIEVSDTISIEEVVDLTGSDKQLPIINENDKVELALDLVRYVHIRSNKAGGDFEIRIEKDTLQIEQRAPVEEEWTKRGPRRMLRTASISVTAVERMAISSRSSHKMPPIGGISEDVEDAASRSTGFANANETASTGQADYDPHRDIILTTNNKVPIHYANAPPNNNPDPPMMNIVAKYGSNDLEPQVVVTAHAISTIPGTTNSNSVLRLTVRMPMVAIVDEEASNSFVQQLVSVLRIYVDEEGTMSLQAKSDRTCKPSTVTSNAK